MANPLPPVNYPDGFDDNSTLPPVSDPNVGMTFQFATISNGDSPYTATTAGSYIKFISVDTSSGSVYILLPIIPPPGSSVIIKDISGLAATNNITIDGNGNNVENTGTLIISTNNRSVWLVFDDTGSWRLVN